MHSGHEIHSGHYVTYFKCEGLWYYYNDLGPKIKLIGNYEDLLSYKSESVKTKGALYFYSEEEKSQSIKRKIPTRKPSPKKRRSYNRRSYNRRRSYRRRSR